MFQIGIRIIYFAHVYPPSHGLVKDVPIDGPSQKCVTDSFIQATYLEHCNFKFSNLTKMNGISINKAKGFPFCYDVAELLVVTNEAIV
jgi:hypothetical protein